MLIAYQAFPTAVFERVIENSDTAYTSSMESTLFHEEKNSALDTCDLPSGTSARRCELTCPRPDCHPARRSVSLRTRRRREHDNLNHQYYWKPAASSQHHNILSMGRLRYQRKMIHR